MTQATPSALSDAFVSSFNEGDAAAVAAHYADDGQWVLSNGTRVVGRAMIEALLDGAFAEGAGHLEVSEPRVFDSPGAVYVGQTFSFALNPSATISGRRYTVWTAGDEGQPTHIAHDVWVPQASADDELGAEVRARAAEVDAATNAGSLDRLRAAYADDAAIVLSNGTLIGGDGLATFLERLASMGVNDLASSIDEVIPTESGAIALGRFSVTVSRPDGPVALAGRRLTLWARDGDSLRLVLEVSWASDDDLT